MAASPPAPAPTSARRASATEHASGQASGRDDASAVWLLDVDGVVNILPSADTPPADRWRDTVRTTVKDGHTTWPISFSPSLVAGICAVHARGLAQVRWLTTWSHAIDEFAEAAGLPQMSVAGHEPHPKATPGPAGRAVWWKHACAARVADEVSRLVWTDDDLFTHPAAWRWTRSRSDIHAPRIKPSVGISPRQLQVITGWLLGSAYEAPSRRG